MAERSPAIPARTLAEEAAERAAAGVPDGEAPEARALARAYVEAAEPDDVPALTPAGVAAAVVDHFAFVRSRRRGEPVVRVVNPSRAVQGWESRHTVVDLATDDMPFIVDSVLQALVRRGSDVHLMLHRTGDATASMHLEIDRETDPHRLEAARDALVRVLADVRNAVEDWEAMLAQARALAAGLRSHAPATVDPADAAEAATFLEWLTDDHFTFLGACTYDLVVEGDRDELRLDRASVRGVLRSRELPDLSPGFSGWDPELRSLARVPWALTLTKSLARSTVHRAAPYDYVGVKRFGPGGEVVGETRFTGLYTANVYSESTASVPVLRRKVAAVLARAGLDPRGHDGRALVHILETAPRDELFRLSVEELCSLTSAILRMGERRRVRLFVSPDQFRRFVSCLVYVPRDRYTTPVRNRVVARLREAFGGVDAEYTALVGESVLARLHVIVSTPLGPAAVDEAALEAELAGFARAWIDDFEHALVDARGEEAGLHAFRTWGDAFPAAYQADVPAREAVADLTVLEGLEPSGDLVVRVEEEGPGEHGRSLVKLYRTGGPLELSDVMPVLERLGVTVIDEHPYEIAAPSGAVCWIDAFGVRAVSGDPLAEPAAQDRVAELFLGVWAGEVENDALNQLVLRAGLAPREVVIVRALVRYLHQGGVHFGDDHLAATLAANAAVTRALVALFHARFDPDRPRDAAVVDSLETELSSLIDAVVALEDDRLLRALWRVVSAAVRTNAYQRDDAGRPRPALAIKLDASSIDFLPAPRPRHEIWVYAPRVEGVHLRAGDVARGGIRWSDRRDDFRTEVLGLMKAQTVKNSVIVPTGAKGGFVVKRPPNPSDRAAVAEEVLACYRVFIGALLDVTDNATGASVVAPERVVRYDRDDPYLVVAADKGTAAFSDHANALAIERGFWLGDAFASGGSAGFDHKAMGITSRGAWMSVRAHFRAVGIDADTAPLTVVGIGDMSGDVFGNGLLRSRHVRLVAAFDHRHVFVDPDPDPGPAFDERARLFALPTSSWADYDPARLSAGGGVYERSAKAVELSPEARAALGIDVATMTPDELVGAVLRAPVDLLWNGGIGTYVKASTERHADVGDRANDATRIDADTLRCRVVGEGGNLGFTQAARVEYALAGGRINTDAIDNSAGVDCSDHEVNVKILLERAIAAGVVDRASRDELLHTMTDDVAELVLADNEAQANALAIAAVEAPMLVGAHARLMERLELTGSLDRALEGLPNAKVLQERHAAGLGLTSPELAVLLAHTKLELQRALVDSDVPDDPELAGVLRDYFPPALRTVPAEVLASHRLHREIVATRLANDVVNRAGITFLTRLGDETGAGGAVLAAAHVVAREVFDAVASWEAIDALDLVVPAGVQNEMFLAVRRLVERGARWLVHHGGDLELRASIDRFRPGVREVLAALPGLLGPTAAAAVAAATARLREGGVPGELAASVAAADVATAALPVVAVAEARKLDPLTVGGVHFLLAERLGLESLRDRIVALPRADRWQTEARAALRDDFLDAQRALTEAVLAETDATRTSAERVDEWATAHAARVARYAQVVDDIEAGGVFELATLAVARRALRELAEPDD